MLFTAVVIAAVQAPSQSSLSPVETQARALEESSPELRYEFIKEAVPGFGIPQRRYVSMPIEQQIRAVLNVYYLQALQKAVLVYRGDPDLVEILNRYTVNAPSLANIILEFEAIYKSKFGKWPPIVPVDVDDLLERMLSDKTIR